MRIDSSIKPLASDTANADRQLLYRPIMERSPTKNSAVVLDICIDKSGAVVSAIFDKTQNIGITDTAVINNYLKMAKKYKFESRNKNIECGNIRFNFKGK